jgi:hypothetical protein
MNLSVNTPILTMQAVDAEIKRRQSAVKAETIADDEVEENGQYILDLARALSELGGANEQACKQHPELRLSSPEKWLSSE